MMTRPETVFLDAGGVFLHPNWTRVAGALAERGMLVETASLARADLAARHALDVAASSRYASDDARVAAYLRGVFAEAGISGDAADDAARELRRYHAERNLWETVPDDVRPALGRLRALGLRLVVVSNANGTLAAHLGRLGLSTLFDAALDSFEEGVEKPDPRLFEAALKRSGARAATTLHVGDLYHVDVVGARLAGLRAILFDPGNLYADADCERVSSLHALADRLWEEEGPFASA